MFVFRVCLAVISLGLYHIGHATTQNVVIYNKSAEDLCLYYIKGNTVVEPTPSFVEKNSKTDMITLDNSQYPIKSSINAVIRIVGCYGHGPWLSVIFAASLKEKMKLMNCYYPSKCSVDLTSDNIYNINIDGLSQ